MDDLKEQLQYAITHSEEPQKAKQYLDAITNLEKTLDEIESIVYANISNIDCRILIQEVLDKMKEGK